MTFQVFFQLLNLITLICLVFLLKAIYDRLYRPENRSYFLAVIGLSFDLVGNYCIGQTADINVACVCFRLAIIGRTLFGLGLFGYVKSKFNPKSIPTMFATWFVLMFSVLVHSFRIPKGHAYLDKLRLENIYGINILVGERGVVYYASLAISAIVLFWMGCLFLKRLKASDSQRGGRDVANTIYFLCALGGLCLSALIYEFVYENSINFMPFVKLFFIVLYLVLDSQYHMFSYEDMFRQTMLVDTEVAFIFLSDRKELLYANNTAAHFFPELGKGEEGDIISDRINDIIDRKEIQIEKNGRSYRISAERVFESGRLIGYKLMGLDITDMIMLEKQAEINAETRSNLLTNISHEIRTPLNAIMGASDMLNDEGLSEEAFNDYVDIIRAGAMNLDDILNDLLASANEVDKVQITDMAPYSICTLIDNVTFMCNERIGNKRIYFNTYVAPNVPINAIGDDGRIRQILLNIITNAIRYTDDGIVSLRVLGNYLLDGRYEYEYVITDTGKNAFASDVDFDDMLNEGNELGVDFSTGYGIGLMVAKKLVKSIDGDISVHSIRGRGSIFTVRFPSQVLDGGNLQDERFGEKLRITLLANNQSEFDSFVRVCKSYDVDVDYVTGMQQLNALSDSERRICVLMYDYEKAGKRVEQSRKAEKYVKVAVLPDGKVPTGKSSNNVIFVSEPLSALTLRRMLLESSKKDNYTDIGDNFTAPGARILVVDDNDINLSMARAVLEQFKVYVDTAESGYRCMNMLENGRSYDLILMDYMMEGMDGIETTINIRKFQGEISRIPIIAFTANAVEGAREKYLAAGMNDCLFKPASSHGFAEILKRYLPKELIVRGAEYRETEESVASEESYPDVEGIDKVSAMKYTSGNAESYRDMLATFADEYEKRRKHLVECFEQGDFKNFTIEAHGIKGQARILGMTQLSEQMYALEKAGSEEDAARIKLSMNDTLRYYEMLTGRLSPFLEEKRSKARKPVGNDEAEKILIRIHELLEDFEIEEAEKEFGKLWPGEYNSERKALMRCLKESIEQVDYYASLDYVDKLLNTYSEQ